MTVALITLRPVEGSLLLSLDPFHFQSIVDRHALGSPNNAAS